MHKCGRKVLSDLFYVVKFDEKFESIDAISEGNIPTWYRFQRNAGN
jgi:hypothetical protein